MTYFDLLIALAPYILNAALILVIILAIPAYLIDEELTYRKWRKQQ